MDEPLQGCDVSPVLVPRAKHDIIDVPMEYRAQVQGRCQRQYFKDMVEGKLKDHAQGSSRPAISHWIDEWRQFAVRKIPFTSDGVNLLPHDQAIQIDWRLISNSGVDEGFIRPVIAAGGWPLIPGSSIKGLFRRACREIAPMRVMAWCGGETANGETQPGLLRFHGAWPADEKWKNQLLDVAHPQQKWQVGIQPDDHSANAVVSLHEPRLNIAVSSTDPQLKEDEWKEIRSVLRHALGRGIGGRTCAGYGSSGQLSGDILFQCGLEGQGPAAKLLEGTAEFRPSMFRATIRGMALRLFGGLTDPVTALRIVGQLFGSVGKEEGQNVGLLAMVYTNADTHLDFFGRGSWEQPIYATTGLLQWRLTRLPGSDTATPLLSDLLAALHGLTMSLAGFGRGWRRPDHRIFYQRRYDKTPIGCHWQWSDPSQLPPWIHVQSARDLAQLLERARQVAGQWLEVNHLPTGTPAPWREVLHPQRMRIWTRPASGPADAVAVDWFHQAPEEGDHLSAQSDPMALKRTILAGQMNQVGLIWNRLLPLIGKGQAVQSVAVARPANPLARPTAAALARPGGPSQRQAQTPRPRGVVSIAAHQGDYLESLVLHSLPGNARAEERQQYQRFIAEMNRGASADFQPLDWS